MKTSNALLGIVVLSAMTSALVAALLQPKVRAPETYERTLDHEPTVTQEQYHALVRAVDELERALEQRLIVPRSSPTREPATAAARSDPPAKLELAGLRARVETLEALLERYISVEERGLLEMKAEPEVPILDLQAGALDATLEAEERVQMLRDLRGQRDELGNDARSPEVIEAMIAIAESTQDDGLRADVWRQLDGSTEGALRDPLLRSLQLDPSANVRSEAAETLGNFVSDPLVENALRHAASNDPDEGVREEAQRSLGH